MVLHASAPTDTLFPTLHASSIHCTYAHISTCCQTVTLGCGSHGDVANRQAAGVRAGPTARRSGCAIGGAVDVAAACNAGPPPGRPAVSDRPRIGDTDTILSRTLFQISCSGLIAIPCGPRKPRFISLLCTAAPPRRPAVPDRPWLGDLRELGEPECRSCSPDAYRRGRSPAPPFWP